MNIAIIFAGGVGQRMNSKSVPKQFLELYGKPIIIYTLEVFEAHRDIDGIVISCVNGWIEHLSSLIKHFNLTKISRIVKGGETGQDSIYNALAAAEILYPNDSIVLIHDGVRPIIDLELITRNINCVKENGSAITSVPVSETFATFDDKRHISMIPNREAVIIAKAPQSFILSEILAVHKNAIADGLHTFIDSCSMMYYYNKKLTLVEGDSSNIKITRPIDFYLFRAIIDARENSQIFGM
ncbi:MAG: 2-C-methyl-D-erythritol 4-phosphate cytidylyltransferase [Tannerellaceae bacterium]|jgi:2-C-methyl-D-erythritol 4-phosphate cytidylyltransferase|nr:2-C-methyl-D-erythritol 4-phosphate cytidylyltransferase [Tannerellaceae bacterium]